MSTIDHFSSNQIHASNSSFSSFKVILESAFYATNVRTISTTSEAYQLAKTCSGTIQTDLPIDHAKELGLPEDAKVLIFNDGRVTGRTAAARVVIGEPGINAHYYEGILREAVFSGNSQAFNKTSVLVGLDQEFMVRSHLMIPTGYENNLYSYMLNFQNETLIWNKTYQSSTPLKENDIYLYADPNWQHPDFPNGLALFDVKHNVAAILGLRYFGELKKATLTLAWATATRNNFIACHGGVKQYHLADGKSYTMASFGLSGSGKSTITLANHKNKQSVSVLHDDAFVINKKTGATTALEPAYFDKTQDYSLESDAIRYFLTLQNVGATMNEDNKIVPILEDIRNSNGRTVKSRFVTPNRVDHCSQQLDAVYWIMKDDSLPPLVRIDSPELAAVFGLTLSTKRSTAENIIGKVDHDALVIEPFANPFRAYPLAVDYLAFRELFSKEGTACYILNTGFFLGKKVTPAVTLKAIETIIENKERLLPFGPLDQMSYLPIEGFGVDFTDKNYVQHLKDRLLIRLKFIQSTYIAKQGYNKVDSSAQFALEKLLANFN